jgi:hypothetical protein
VKSKGPVNALKKQKSIGSHTGDANDWNSSRRINKDGLLATKKDGCTIASDRKKQGLPGVRPWKDSKAHNCRKQAGDSIKRAASGIAEAIDSAIVCPCVDFQAIDAHTNSKSRH